MFLKQPFGQIGGSYCRVPDFTGAPSDGRWCKFSISRYASGWNTGPQVCLTALELGVLNLLVSKTLKFQTHFLSSHCPWNIGDTGAGVGTLCVSEMKMFASDRLLVSPEMRAWAPAQTLESKLCFKLCFLWFIDFIKRTALHGWMWCRILEVFCRLR